MSYVLPDVKKAEVSGKKVFLRLDLDIPLSEVGSERIEARISDDMRLKAGLPTIELLLKNNAEIIIAGHLGRPNGRDLSFSLKPIADWLAAKFQISNTNIPSESKFQIGEFDGWKIGENLTLLENLRFYPEEESFGSTQDKDSELDFAKKLASLAQIYVNDAFGESHRSHASIAGVPQFLPHFAGLRLQKEVEVLSKVLENPQKPFVVIIGGAKIETKLPLVEKMHNLADYVLVGGEIASKETILSKIQHEKAKAITIVADLNQDGTDITEKSLENFLQFIERAKTTVWNGPMGKIIVNSKLQIANKQSLRSDELSERGTREIANAIVNSSAHTIVGGGDTVGFLKRIGLIDQFSFVSTGGGAMLEFLSGEKLPGLEALFR